MAVDGDLRPDELAGRDVALGQEGLDPLQPADVEPAHSVGWSKRRG